MTARRSGPYDRIMTFTIVKFLISAVVITGASELAKRSNTFAALLISLPLISILSFLWVYLESRDATKVAELSTGTLLLVLPSLAFFVVLSVSIKFEMNFWISFGLAIGGTLVAYLIYWKILSMFGVHI